MSITVGTPSVVAEDGPGTLAFTFTRTGATTSPLTVAFSVGGSASFPSDYSAGSAASFTSNAGSLTFTAGASTAVVVIDPVADSVIEPDETVIITLTPSSGYTVSSGSGSATGTIADDDAIVSVQWG